MSGLYLYLAELSTVILQTILQPMQIWEKKYFVFSLPIGEGKYKFRVVVEFITAESPCSATPVIHSTTTGSGKKPIPELPGVWEFGYAESKASDMRAILSTTI